MQGVGEREGRVPRTLREESKAHICVHFCFLKTAPRKAPLLQIIKITLISLGMQQGILAANLDSTKLVVNLRTSALVSL